MNPNIILSCLVKVAYIFAAISEVNSNTYQDLLPSFPSYLGKTSLCNVLYRLYPLTSGSIEIGGINIASVELSWLRRAMAVIPQDPTLFVGTIRFNLDPNNEFTDDQIWMSLGKTYLKDMV